MLKEEIVEVEVTNNTIKWYESKGYEIPKEEVQLYCYNKLGKKVKNGKDLRVRNWTKIKVNVKDLPPKSNHQVTLVCEECGKEYTTTFQFYSKKKTDKCTECEKKTPRPNGKSHQYWIRRLITDNPEAKCDISGETDKRFLVLHHLTSKSDGGKNTRKNYVILSANYHMAFHNSIGGTTAGCTPEQYLEFKENELCNQ